MFKTVILAFTVMAAVVAAKANDDSLDEFFQRERDILGGDPGGSDEYECNQCRKKTNEMSRDLGVVLYTRRKELRYDCGVEDCECVPTAKSYDRPLYVRPAPVRRIWDPLNSDSATHVFVE